jgi:hypothetical protein
MFDHSCTFIYYLNPIVWWAITMLQELWLIILD